MKKEISVFAPATIANVVCGFDVLGFAINAPGDQVEMKLTNAPGVVIKKITGDGGILPLDAAKNTVSVSIRHFLKHIGQEDVGIEIVLHKKMPIGSGLGSSSASTVAGLFALNKLMGEPLTKKELVPFAMKGEELASGYGHADNVAPAIMGGFVLVRSYNPLDIIALPSPKEMYVAIVYPEVNVPTKDAREMIKNKIYLKDAVTQWGNVAGLVSGLFLNDFDLIGRSMKDVLIEPIRAILIPGFEQMRKISKEHGGIGFGISGSGPSVFSLAKNLTTAQQIVKFQQRHLRQLNINSKTYVSEINAEGPKVLQKT